MYYDSFDICLAHYTFAYLFHGGQDCPIYSKLTQLNRLRFNPGLSSNVGNPIYLEGNAKEIYRQLVVNHHGLHSTNPPSHARSADTGNYKVASWGDLVEKWS